MIEVMFFCSPTCGPCKMMEAQLKQLDQQQFSFVKNDVTLLTEQQLSDYKVISVPTTIFIKDGIEIKRFEKALSKQMILDQLK